LPNTALAAQITLHEEGSFTLTDLNEEPGEFSVPDEIPTG
jgi:hypothetical protein